MNRRGFTLLELIIVIIVLGVLTSLALPVMFSMVTKAKAAEAIKSLSLIDKGLQGCLSYSSGGGTVAAMGICRGAVNDGNLQILGINDPENEIASNFDYSVNPAGSHATEFRYAYIIRANQKDDFGNSIYFMRGYGTFVGVGYCGGTARTPTNGARIEGCGAFDSINIEM